MSKPNIILIYCDELRVDALGCYGHEHVAMKTPHIDYLAQSGARFSNCFCTSPVCVPSRTSHLTGLYPEDTGVYHNEAGWAGFSIDDPPITFPEVFADHGYQTANFGKTHIPKPLNPWGYSENSDLHYFDYLQLLATEDFSKSNLIFDYDRPWVILGGTYPVELPFHSNMLVENAIKWMRQTKEPFLVRLSIQQPHSPVLVPKPFDEIYDPAGFSGEVDFNPESSIFERIIGETCKTGHMSVEDHQRIKAYYYGLVAWIDYQVGLLLDYLKLSGTLQDTIIVFEADHGVSLGEGKRYHKLNFAPESHRVPRIISYPAKLQGGQISDEINHSLDLARTLFALAGIEPHSQFKGRDLFLDPAPDAIFSTIGFGLNNSYIAPLACLGQYTQGRGWPRRTCIRTSQYRLDKNVRIDQKPVDSDDDDIFLVDYRKDPKEVSNLASLPEYQGVVKELSALIDAHVGDAIESPIEYFKRSGMSAKEVIALRETLLEKFGNY